MKASDLKPGQFFQYLEWRCLCIAICKGSQTVLFARKDESNMFRCGTNTAVTPLAVTCWDEPQSEPPRVTDIAVCKLPYQETFFIRGACNGKDVWLTRDGKWTTNESGDECGFAMSAMSVHNDRICQLESALRNALHVLEKGTSNEWPALKDVVPEAIEDKETLGMATAEPLQLREGAWYRRRDGEVVGPIEPYNPSDGRHYKQPWKVWNGEYNDTYYDDGHWNVQREEQPLDLIAEVPPPVEPAASIGSCHGHAIAPAIKPEQFKAGDWVVADSGVSRTRYGETPKQLIEATKYCAYVEKDIPFHPSHFRRATDDEIEHHRKQGSCQGHALPHADGWIEWHGGECPFPEGVPIDVRFRDGYERLNSTSYNTCKTFWLDENNPADIVAYRLAQPAPQLDWVEVVTR